MPGVPGNGLRVAVGQHADRGRKPTQQDFHGICMPAEPLLSAKGIAMAVADGISSSGVSHVASQTAVASFLEDYFSTPETWSVQKSAQRVMGAANAWLHAQTRQSAHRHDQDRGYVCTMTVVVFKSTTAHILHVGDACLYRLRGDEARPLTEAHRAWLASDKPCLARALGLAPHVEIDYHTQPLLTGDVFMLATDGVYDYLASDDLRNAVATYADDLDAAARSLVDLALARGSDDNLTVQIVRIEGLPDHDVGDLARHARALPCPPLPSEGDVFDGFRILRSLRAGSRSHVYLAEDMDDGARVVLKLPSLDLRHDPAYLERLLMEEWVARRISSRHVARASAPGRPRSYLYIVLEYIPGTTLTQWMAEHPHPSLEQVRGIVEQIARGLQSLHRREVLHQDLRPDNVLIDGEGTVRIIDLGSARVAGVTEIGPPDDQPDILGTAQYAAPEYFVGEPGSYRADQYSLGVIAYQMLSGRLPYGAEVAKTRTRADQLRLVYTPVADGEHDVPAWVDSVLARAVHPDPVRRFTELSEFVHALRRPGLMSPDGPTPLLKRNPLLFWQGLCLLLTIALLVLIAQR